MSNNSISVNHGEKCFKELDSLRIHMTMECVFVLKLTGSVADTAVYIGLVGMCICFEAFQVMSATISGGDSCIYSCHNSSVSATPVRPG